MFCAPADPTHPMSPEVCRMNANPPEFPFLSNVGLMLTYKCSIACPHCIVEAGPHRKEEVQYERAAAWIEQASTYRDGHIKGLALTGGEPFYNLENLTRVSSYGERLGLAVSVVTNAFWAASRDEALSVLSRVPAIQAFSFSTDVYHQRSIPLDYIENAVWAAGEMGRQYNVAVCTDNEDDQQYRRILEKLESTIGADRIRLSITFPAGRARKTARHLNYHAAPEPTVAACSMASSPVIFPDGRVNACIGPLLTLPAAHPLFLGNIEQESLADILDRAELNPILHAIRAWGPHKLVSLLRQHGHEGLLPREYISNCICDPCYKLLSDSRIVDALENILLDEQAKQVVAYARLYYLNETTMVEKIDRQTLDWTTAILPTTVP